MAAGDFSSALCEQLHKVPKYVPSTISWREKVRKCGGILIFQAQVLTEDGIGLELAGHWRMNNKHGRATWGFSLRYLGNLVRSYDMARKHKNPQGRWIRGPHKHKFSSSKIDRLAYKPDPPISESDPNAGLMGFLKEENIALRVPYNYHIF